MTKRFNLLLCLFILGSFWLSCKNPFKDEPKKELVIILFDEYVPETGKIYYYWDGKDKSGKYIKPGKYIYVMEAKTWQDQDFVMAQEGGKPDENNRARFEPGSWLYFELGTAEPNPFKILSGVTIPFTISTPSRVKISIYKD